MANTTTENQADPVPLPLLDIDTETCVNGVALRRVVWPDGRITLTLQECEGEPSSESSESSEESSLESSEESSDESSAESSDESSSEESSQESSDESSSEE